MTDAELNAVLAAARPLDVGDRDAFLQAVAAALQSEGEIGPGVVRRVCAELQRQYFDPPQFVSGDSGVSKYDRVLRRARTG